MKRTLCFVSLIGALSLASCGEPLATGKYLGEPLLELQGNIVLVGESEYRDNKNLRVAVRWLDAPDKVVNEQVLTDGGLGRYTMRLYTPPPRSAMRDLPEKLGQVAFASVLLYDDRDGDGVWSEHDEPIRGGNPERLIVYAPDAIMHSGLGLLVPKGYATVEYPGCVAEDDELIPEVLFLSGETFNLTVLDDLEEEAFDVDCDGRFDDPCLELVLSFDDDTTRTEEEKIEELDACYEQYYGDDVEFEFEPCEAERVAFEQALEGEDHVQIELFDAEYQRCLISHDITGYQGGCGENFDLDEERYACECPEPFELVDPYTCVDCGHPDAHEFFPECAD